MWTRHSSQPHVRTRHYFWLSMSAGHCSPLILSDGSFPGLKWFSLYTCIRKYFSRSAEFYVRLSRLVLCMGTLGTMVSPDSQLHLFNHESLPSSARIPYPHHGTIAWKLSCNTSYVICFFLATISAIHCLMCRSWKTLFRIFVWILGCSCRRINGLLVYKATSSIS